MTYYLAHIINEVRIFTDELIFQLVRDHSIENITMFVIDYLTNSY